MTKKPMCVCGHPKRGHTVAGEHKCSAAGCQCRGYQLDEGSNYLDMTIREVFQMMDRVNAGRFHFNGPGPKGEQIAPYCCAFALGLQDAAKMSKHLFGSTAGLPKERK